MGDRAFQKKCINRIREIMMDESVTVLFVTHTSATAKAVAYTHLDVYKRQEWARKDERIVIVDKPNSGYGASMNLSLIHIYLA